MDSDLATFSDIPANYVLAAASCVAAAVVAGFVLLGGKKEAKPYARFPSPRSWVAALKKGARRTEGWLEANAEGVPLWWQEFLPAGNPKGVVIFAHGIMEHSARYDHILEQLCADHQLAVYSMDHVNHGKSTKDGSIKPPSCYFGKWSTVIDDWRGFVAFARKRAAAAVHDPDAFPIGSGETGAKAPLPFFLMGNSFGAMVSLHTLLQETAAKPLEPAGVVMVAPFIDVPRPLLLKIQEALGPLLNVICPTARLVEAAQPKLLSQDTAAIDNYVTDPLNNTNKIQVRPGYLMGNATFWLADRISEFTHPFLILHGTNDVCTSFPHAKNFYETAASDDKTFQPVDGAYHLLSHGPERKYVAKAAGEWIAARL